MIWSNKTRIFLWPWNLSSFEILFRWAAFCRSVHRVVFRGFWWVHRGTAISIRLRSWYWQFIIKFNGFLWWSWHVIMPWFFRKFWFMVGSTTGWVSFQRHFSDSCVCGRFVFRGGRTSRAQLDFLLSKVNARGWGFDPLPWGRKVVGGQKPGLRTRVSRPLSVRTFLSLKTGPFLLFHGGLSPGHFLSPAVLPVGSLGERNDVLVV